MKIYILIAKGILSEFNSSDKIISRKAFSSQQDAINYSEKFKLLCQEQRDNSLTNLIPETVKISIQEIELVKENET